MQNNGNNTELIRDLLNGDCNGLHKKFGLFLDQCPSFLHSANNPGFFPAFFFGMFATVFDSDIVDFDPNIANGERIYFRFDNYGNGKGNLKVAVLTNDVDENDMRIVRCYTVADNENSPGSRFSEEERQWVEENQLQGLQDGLVWKEYKIFRLGEECAFFPQGNAFLQRDEPDDLVFHEIVPIMQQGELLNLVEALVSGNANIVDQNIREILEYILDVYDTYQQELNFGVESDYHGFLSGFLINFRYRAMAEVYVELIMGGGYADVVLLVRGQGNLNNSVPIVIELKAGPEALPLS